MKISAQGVGGDQDAELVQDVTIEVGNLKLTGVSVVVIDLDADRKGGRTADAGDPRSRAVHEQRRRHSISTGSC